MVLSFDICESFASSIKKNFKDNKLEFLILQKQIKKIIYETFLRLTPSYCAVILN